MYYYGYFRNIDDSIDKDGQLFKVVIFTDCANWEHSTIYPFEVITFDGEPTTVLIPESGTELTMTAQPFTVEYANDDESIFKPYKCSTASISFLQSELNKEFLNINGRNVLVALLKWNNDVVYNEIYSRYENTKTGEFLYKDLITNPITGGVMYNDFTPYKVDKFCYNTEWIGFSTPETYSMGYVNLNDVFTLNAQDALSILQYSKFSKGSLEFLKTITDVFNVMLADLGTYQHIYISDSLVIPSPDRDAITAKIFAQLPNYFDEDGEPVDKLTVIEELCKTLNITIVPFQDSIYIVDYNALANGNDMYYHYQLSLGVYFFNNIIGRNYSYVGTKRLEHLHNINANSFSLTGTNITTSNTYNSIKLTDDDYFVGNIAPDVEDNNSIDTENEENLGQNSFYYTWTENNETKYEYWLFEGYSYDFAERSANEVYDKGEMIAYNYNLDYFHEGYNNTYTYRFNTTPLTGSNRIGYSDFTNYIGVCALDYNATQTDTLGTIPMNYDLKRVVYFHTPTLSNVPTRLNYDGHWNDIYHPEVYPNKAQKLLTIKTKNFLGDVFHYIQVVGKWTFFNKPLPINNNHIKSWNAFENGGTTSSDVEISDGAVYPWCRIDAKVKCYIGSNVYYLRQYGSDYIWETTEQFVRLSLNDSREQEVFNNSIKFKQNRRGIDGINFQLPFTDNNTDVCYLEIDIYRPYGVGNLIASSTMLEEFEINLLSKDYVDSMGQTNADENNTEYKQEIFSSAVCDFQGLTLKNTTTNDKNLNYSHLVYKKQTTDTSYFILDSDITNAYTGLYGKPEELIINNIVQQYKNPMIKLEMNLHYNIGFTPYSLITWNTQFEGKKFVIDSMGIDYEMNRNTLKIVEKNPDLDFNDIYRMNVQKKFRRNGELNTIDRVKGAKEVITHNTELPTQGKVYGIEYSSGNAKLQSYYDTPEKFINFKVKFMDGDLLVAIPPEIEDAIEAEVNYTYGDLTITET